MKHSEVAGMARELAVVVRQHVSEAITPALARLSDLEARMAALPAPPAADDVAGLVILRLQPEVDATRAAFDALRADMGETVAAEVAKAVAAIPVPQDGKDGVSVTVEDVAPLIAAEVAKAAEALPVPQDGKDGRDGVDGKDGASVSLGDVLPLVGEAVAKAMAAIPAPKDGRDGLDGKDGADGASFTADDAAPLIAEAVTKAVAAIPVPKNGKDGLDGKDGVGLAGALIDREGSLVVTLSNGEAKALGPVVGRDGADGKPGAPGLHGLGFDDLSVEPDGERAFVLRFQRGDQVKTFRFEAPVVLDRGVFKAADAYAKGDAVSYGGSLWIAQEDAPEGVPGASPAWRLAVKKGRDGRDGRDVKLEPQGPVKAKG